MDVIARLIFGPSDLFDDDALFTLQLFGIDEGVEHHVGENVDAVLDFTGKDAAVIARHLLVGECIEGAAPAFDFFGDLAGSSGVGALEEHVLDEVGDAGLVLFFVTAAGLAPESHGGGLDVGDGLDQDADPVIEVHFYDFAHLVGSVVPDSV